MLYFVCPDIVEPAGGVKVIYRHVDILNGLGLTATVLHKRKGFRCNWFKNRTAVTYFSDIMLRKSDLLVLPEVYGQGIVTAAKGIRKVIFNQNCYFTFLSDGFNENMTDSPYRCNEVIATIVVSEDSRNYLQYVFPDLTIHRVHLSIDFRIVSLQRDQKADDQFYVAKTRRRRRSGIQYFKTQRYLE